MEALLELVAGVGVGNRQREEPEADGQHEEVQHLPAPAE